MRIRKPNQHIVGQGNNHEAVLLDTYKALRGNISFGRLGQNGLTPDNLDGAFGVVANTGLAGTDFTVMHNLNRIPIGYKVMRQNGFGIYKDGVTAWTKTQIFLQCNLPNLSVTFWVF